MVVEPETRGVEHLGEVYRDVPTTHPLLEDGRPGHGLPVQDEVPSERHVEKTLHLSPLLTREEQRELEEEVPVYLHHVPPVVVDFRLTRPVRRSVYLLGVETGRAGDDGNLSGRSEASTRD